MPWTLLQGFVVVSLVIGSNGTRYSTAQAARLEVVEEVQVLKILQIHAYLELPCKAVVKLGALRNAANKQFDGVCTVHSHLIRSVPWGRIFVYVFEPRLKPIYNFVPAVCYAGTQT